MNAINGLLLLMIFIGIHVMAALAIYVLSKKNIFFTQPPQGEIIAVMHAEKFHHFIANIVDHWVDPVTGEVWRTKRFEDGFDDIGLDGRPGKNARVKPDVPPDYPRGFMGIYWLGAWPAVTVYEYTFKWNLWTKRGDSESATRVGEGSTEYDFEPHEKEVDSIYHTATYGFRSNRTENKDKIPVDVNCTVTIRVVNAYIALFVMKSGWLENLTGRVHGAIRDYTGSASIDDLTSSRHESGKPSPSARRKTSVKKPKERMTFNDELKALNDDIGNESIRKTLGVEVVVTSFMSYDIADGKLKEQLQGATTRIYVATQEKNAYVIETDKLVDRENRLGDARAAAAEKLKLATKDNPHAGTIIAAEENRKGLEALAAGVKGSPTIVLSIGGQPAALPIINVGEKKNG